MPRIPNKRCQVCKKPARHKLKAPVLGKQYFCNRHNREYIKKITQQGEILLQEMEPWEREIIQPIALKLALMWKLKEGE